MSASKLRSFVSRNRYQEMLYGDDDMTFLMQDEDKKDKAVKPKKGRERERGIKEKVSSKSDQVSVNVYTGKAEPEKEKCGCDEINILEEQDAQGVIMKLAPELYRTLMAKSYLMDLCNLNRMRREHEVCAVACDPKSYNRWACCEKPCCPTGGVVAGAGKGLVEVREGARVGDISSFEDSAGGVVAGGGGTPIPGTGGRGVVGGALGNPLADEVDLCLV